VSPTNPSGDRDRRAPGAGEEAIRGTRKGLGAVLPFIGPAFIACVAYVDPGNFATNIGAGARFGYDLLWVVVYASIMAMIIQTLSAKLGIATARNLPELMREHFPSWLIYPLWIVAEVMAMATDVAEFVGASVGFNLLLHVPLFIGAVLAGVATFGMLYLQRFGFRPLEALITAFVLVIAGCYIGELVIAKPVLGSVAYHSVVPFANSTTFLLTAGILGATVMPHVVYLHSALTQDRIHARSDTEKRRLFRFTLIDIFAAMPLAGLVNGGMLIMAAVVFHEHGHDNLTDLASAYRTLSPFLGPVAATLFAISLLAAGLSSSTVGTMAGQVIMQGFVGFSIPLWVRRVVTMAPSFVVIGLGLPTATTLVVSQVVLSIVLAFAVVPLMWFTCKKRVMGVLVNHPITAIVGWICAGTIVLLNGVLVYTLLGGAF
jgi:manganese transport protein